jgi:MFS family permease
LAVVAIDVALHALPADAVVAHSGRLDIGGAALATTATGALAWGLTVGSGASGWTPASLAALAAALALAAAFVWREGRLGDDAMTPLALFGSAPLVGLNLLTLLLYGALAAFMLLLPYLLITSGRYSATAAGAALLPFPLILAVASPPMGDLAGRIGAKGPLIAGSVLAAAGLGLAPLAAGPENYWTGVFPGVAIMALGMACAAAPLTAAVLAQVDARHTGAASGLNSALAQLGGVIAVSLIGGVLARRGGAMADAFTWAAWAGAAAALASGGAVALLFPGRPRPTLRSNPRGETP